MRDRPERKDRGWGWVIGVGVLAVWAVLPGRTMAAGTEGVAFLAGGSVSATLPLAVPVVRAKVQIPPRPELRSPSQPPVWVPGSPPWAGGPTWVPGPPPWTRPALGLVAAKRAATRGGSK